MARAREAIDGLRVERATRESELAGARADRDEKTRTFRHREHELAGIVARLRSLEELAAARAEYGDAARLVLAESSGEVGQMGSVADYLEVDAGYGRAGGACLGDLLQHVVVPTHDHAAAGLEFARSKEAGRVGFLVASTGLPVDVPVPADGLVGVAQVARLSGAATDSIRMAIANMWIAPDYATARSAAGV